MCVSTYELFISHIQEIKTMITDSAPDVLSTIEQVREFRETGKEILDALHSNVEVLERERHPSLEDAALDTNLVRIEYLSALARATPESSEYDTEILSLCNTAILSKKISECMRINLIAAGLAACINILDARAFWIEKAKPLVDHRFVGLAEIKTLAYNYAVVSLEEGNKEEALRAVSLLDPQSPDMRLMAVGLYADQEDKYRSLYFLKSYLHELPEKNKHIDILKRQTSRYLVNDRALVVLTWGLQGIYALIWTGAGSETPKYLSLLNWKDGEALKLECDLLPWASFLNRRKKIKKSSTEFSPKAFVLLQKIWRKLLFPILQNCGNEVNGVDIIPIGWLALIPWAACGEDPSQKDYIGKNISFSILHQFEFLDKSHDLSSSGRASRIIIRGDSSGIEEACRTEERALERLGFQVVEGRNEIYDAVRNAQILHFNGHGRFPDLNDKGAGPHFILTDGSLLKLLDFIERDLFSTPHLVTFGSCELGFSFFSNGQVYGFPGYFLRQGTSACIAPLGKIDPDISTEYFQAFYREIFSGRSIGESTRIALSQQTTSPRGMRNLGLWAPIVIYGDQWLTIPS